jgi:hypothetical protein
LTEDTLFDAAPHYENQHGGVAQDTCALTGLRECAGMVDFDADSNSLLGSFEIQGSRAFATKPVMLEPVGAFAVRRCSGGRVENEDAPFAEVA